MASLSRQRRRQIIKEQLRQQGYTGSISTVRDWSTERIQRELGYTVKLPKDEETGRTVKPRDEKGRFTSNEPPFGYRLLGYFLIEIDGIQDERPFQVIIGVPTRQNIINQLYKIVDKTASRYHNTDVRLVAYNVERYIPRWTIDD